MAGLLTSPEWPALLSLISAAILPFWPMIHMRLGEANERLWNRVDLVLPWLPGLFISLALILDVIAHLIVDMDYQRVASRLDPDSSLTTRLATSLSGWTSGALLFMIGLGLHLAMTSTILDQSGDISGDAHRMHDGVLIWFGIFWVMMMFAVLPDNPFLTGSDVVVPIDLPAPASMLDVMLMAPTLLLAGWLLGFGILHLADVTCPAAWPDTISRPHPGTGWFVALPIVSVMIGLTLDDQNTVSDGMALTDMLLDEVHGRRIGFLLAFGCTMVLTSCAIHAGNVSALRTRVGTNRWKGLVLHIVHATFWIIVGGWCLLAGLPGVDSSWGALALLARLATPMLLLGALGLLLPQVGFDDRSRPEIWGWTLLLLVSAPALALWEPRAALLAITLLPALSLGVLIPALAEGQVRLSRNRRKVWVLTIISFDIVLISALVLYAIEGVGLIVVLPLMFLTTLVPGMMVHAWPDHID